jgi:predicted nucleic acid-binding protein
MLLYLDASARVKRYLSEPGPPETNRAVADAKVTATTIISRVEVSAALAKAVRVGAADREEARSLRDAFQSDWADVFNLTVSGP